MPRASLPIVSVALSTANAAAPLPLRQQSQQQQQPRRLPWKPTLPQRPTRGSLTQQLASITSAVEHVTASLTGRAPPSPAQPAVLPQCTLPALQLRVGRVLARRGSPIAMHSDRAEFTFALRGDTEIEVTLWYRDICGSTRASGPSVAIRVRGSDSMRAFSELAAVPWHDFSLTFSSAATASAFVAMVKGGGGP